MEEFLALPSGNDDAHDSSNAFDKDAVDGHFFAFCQGGLLSDIWRRQQLQFGSFLRFSLLGFVTRVGLIDCKD